MNRSLSIASLAALAMAAPLSAQDSDKPEYPGPSAIVEQAAPEEWLAIAPSDLLVMDLAPDAEGNSRRVVIQLMPEPFSQGWIRNIRKLAAAHWWDGTSVNRVQDNYVVQWGDAGYDNPESGETEQKALPDGLETVPESQYVVDGDTLSEFTGSKKFNEFNQMDAELEALMREAADPKLNEQQQLKIIAAMTKIVDSIGFDKPTEQEKISLILIESTQTELTSQGWHERDSFAHWVELWKGWPLANFSRSTWQNEDGEIVPRPANTQRHSLSQQKIAQQMEQNDFWPVHCYGTVGVGRNLSPDTGSGAELYTVIGHAPRHLDRNIAVVGRVIEGIEHLSSLPRGKGQLGFYEDADKRVPITSIRLASTLPKADQPRFEYLITEGETFARYADARANRRDPFFNVPAGGADICNIPVPVRRVKTE